MIDDRDIRTDMQIIRQPDMLAQAADRIEQAAASVLPRMAEVERRQERMDGQMATQRDMTELERTVDGKLERFAHQITDDLKADREAVNKALITEVREIIRAELDAFLRTDLARKVKDEVDSLREAELREAMEKEKAALDAREAAIRRWAMRLALVTSAISVASALWMAGRFFWGIW